MNEIREATGASVRPGELAFARRISASDFGADPGKTPVENTQAINAAIAEAAKEGGTVLIPAGVFRVYTIRMQSRVNLHLSEGAVLRAARTEITDGYTGQRGEGGNYDEPEVNRYAGLQDHGHSYFANSLIYAADCHDLAITGRGLIDGSSWNDEEDCREFVLLGGDPYGGTKRNEPGHRGSWFGNKGIALVRCERVVLTDFSLLIGGHFAIITEGVKNLYCENLLVDTNRDAFDVDCCQDVTVKNCWFNSLTDDGLVMKSSFGAAAFMPLKNMRIEDCRVSGYDAGSVYARTFTNEKLVAEDRCGPTGRIKFGTEASCGYEQVTILRTAFDHSRGFAMEAVDGSDLKDIIFKDCTMKHVSSSPVFIRIGDRCRFPVTGMNVTEEINAPAPNVRLDNPGFIIPDTDDYGKYPALRYKPSYRRDRKVSPDGCSSFTVVNQEDPLQVNEANFTEENGKYYAKKYVPGKGYLTDYETELTRTEAFSRGNGCSRPLARVSGILIENLTVEDADPRYPIILMGLEGSCAENICLKNIDITWRGGLSLKEAAEQRQVNTNWTYRQYKTREEVQSIPWLVNTFFLKNEGLLPRADWDEKNGCWREDPYNVPELPDVYPEPSNWGILPAYGLYARHVRGLKAQNIRFATKNGDGRHPIVLEDVAGADFSGLCLEKAAADPVTGKVQADAALVTNLYKRPAGFEYVPDYPYHTSSVEEIALPEQTTVELIKVNAPAPGTPADSLYAFGTIAVPETGYHFAVDTPDYPLPETVYPPFLVVAQPELKGEEKARVGITDEEKRTPVADWDVTPVCTGRCREKLSFTVKLCDPANQTSARQASGKIYDEGTRTGDYTVYRAPRERAELVCGNLPEEASLTQDEETAVFSWIPQNPGTVELDFSAVRGSEVIAGARVRLIVE